MLLGEIRRDLFVFHGTTAAVTVRSDPHSALLLLRG